jgi:hypothetical protein
MTQEEKEPRGQLRGRAAQLKAEIEADEAAEVEADTEADTEVLAGDPQQDIGEKEEAPQEADTEADTEEDEGYGDFAGFRVPREILDSYNETKEAVKGVRPVATRKVETADDGTPLDEELFTNPKEALHRFREEVKAEIRQEYQQEQARQQFWSQFYEKYPHLKKAGRICQGVVNDAMQNDPEFAKMNWDQASKYIAGRVQVQILETMEAMGINRKTEVPVTATLSKTSKGRKKVEKPPKKDVEAPVSLSEAIKLRARRRRANS